MIVVYRLVDGMWRPIAGDPVTPPTPPDLVPYGRGVYGAGPYGR